MTYTRIRRHHRTPDRNRGFTIIELLVVVAVIAVFAGIVGLALTDGDRSTALQSSQRTMSAVLTGARGQAATTQEAVYVLVSADEGDPATFLRNVRLARSRGFVTDAGGNIQTDSYGNNIPRVRLGGNPSQFARGVFLVPSTEAAERFSSDADAMLRDYLDALAGRGLSSSQIEQRKSSATYGEVEIEEEGANTRESYLYFRFDRRGFTGSGHRIVLAPAERGPNTVRFDNPDQAVGFLVRPFGSVTMISDPRGFDE